MPKFALTSKSTIIKHHVAQGILKEVCFNITTKDGKLINKHRPKYLTVKSGVKVEVLRYDIIDGVEIPNIKRGRNAKHLKLALGVLSEFEVAECNTVRKNEYSDCRDRCEFREIPKKYKQYLRFNLDYGYRLSDCGKKFLIFRNASFILGLTKEEFNLYCKEL